MRRAWPIVPVLVALAIGLLPASWSGAEAATLASWDLAGQPGNQAVTAGSGSPQVTALDLVRGPGINPAAAGDSMSSNGWQDGPVADPASDPDYFQFGVSIEDGFSLLPESLLIGTRSSNTGPGTIGLFTSRDNFQNPIDQFSQPGADFLYSSVDLSSLGPVAGNLTLRLIEIGNTQADGLGNTAATGTFRISNFFDGTDSLATQLTGTLVPEPTSAWLLLAGLFWLLCGPAFRRTRSTIA
jgi:hypothetical protein